MDFAERLVTLRRESGLTQFQLAEAIGIPRTQLANYEQRKNYPHLDTLVRLADHLKVSLDHLVGRDDYSLGSFVSSVPSDEREQTFMKVVGRLNEERHLYLVQKMSLEDDELKQESRWVYLPNDRIAYGYPVYYVETHGRSVSQLDKFQNAILYIENGDLDPFNNEPIYVLAALLDGTFHVMLQTEVNAKFVSTLDFKQYTHTDITWLIKIVKVEHELT
jgi:transcriptional regulator with XRE-family HTH domain